MSRRFRHRNEDWDVEPTGMGHGVGSGHLPPITSWGMVFRCLSNPNKGEYYASLHTSDPMQVTEEELQKILDSAVVLKALEDPRWDWRTVEGVARDTGIPENEVLAIIESSADEVIRSRVRDAQGRTLYATRQHYTNRRGFLDSFRSV